jgi:hypothetical protein
VHVAGDWPAVTSGRLRVQSFARHVPKEVAGRFYRLRKVYTGPLRVEQSAEPAPYRIGRTGEKVSSPGHQCRAPEDSRPSGPQPPDFRLQIAYGSPPQRLYVGC